MKQHDHQPLRDAIIAIARETEMKVLVVPEDSTQMETGRELLFDLDHPDELASVAPNALVLAKDPAAAKAKAAFHLNGTYHLHYILRHAWRDGQSFSFMHVTSPDMLHWTWHPAKLQPAFTGHGMFSGTGSITAEGRPAVIYHGQSSDRNQIAIATDNNLSAWEKPYPVVVKNADGSEARKNRV